MRRTPFIHALFAVLYIVGVVFLIDTLTKNVGSEATLLIPLIILSLFVLSAAVMGYLFLYEPATRFIDGKKKEAVMFFLQTVGFFACFVALLVVLLFTSHLV
jgi:hypothetical protein